MFNPLWLFIFYHKKCLRNSGLISDPDNSSSPRQRSSALTVADQQGRLCNNAQDKALRLCHVHSALQYAHTNAFDTDSDISTKTQSPRSLAARSVLLHQTPL